MPSAIEDVEGVQAVTVESQDLFAELLDKNNPLGEFAIEFVKQERKMKLLDIGECVIVSSGD